MRKTLYVFSSLGIGLLLTFIDHKFHIKLFNDGVCADRERTIGAYIFGTFLFYGLPFLMLSAMFYEEEESEDESMNRYLKAIRKSKLTDEKKSELEDIVSKYHKNEAMQVLKGFTNPNGVHHKPSVLLNATSDEIKRLKGHTKKCYRCYSN